MAAVIYSFTLQDAIGVKTPVAFFGSTPEAQTLTQIHDNWAELGAVLDAISAAKIVKGQILLRFVPDVAWKAVPEDTSRVTGNGLFSFIMQDTIYRQSYLVPSLADAALDAANKIDITDAGVKALINSLVGGWGAADVVKGIGKHGEDITGFSGCSTVGRTHRRQQMTKTYVDGSTYVA